jgi:hypothetical protein
MIQFVEEEILVPVQLREILTTEEVKAYRRPAAWRQAFDFGLIWAQIFAGLVLVRLVPREFLPISLQSC